MGAFPDVQELHKLKKDKKSVFEKLIRQLQKKKPGATDQLIHSLHHQYMADYDCLSCANCCRTISPMLNRTDIERLGKSTKLSSSAFFRNYLGQDEDGDIIFQQTPCPFLLADNTCLHYESRPRACREYPHTDRKKMKSILPLTLKNAFVCPVVYQIFERLSEELPH